MVGPGAWPAEHGYPLLPNVVRGSRTDIILYDAGLGWGRAVHDLKVLGATSVDISAMGLAHRHADRHGVLEELFRQSNVGTRLHFTAPAEAIAPARPSTA